jgi:hypothetical protein
MGVLNILKTLLGKDLAPGATFRRVGSLRYIAIFLQPYNPLTYCDERTIDDNPDLPESSRRIPLEFK